MQQYAWLSPRARLFVYGTLRPCSGHPMGRVLAHNARALGPATMRGRVSRTGAYPVADAGAQDGWIHGELFEVRGGQAVWRVLDRYEGCFAIQPDYARKPVNVWLGCNGRGRWTVAWCYVMAG